MEGSLHLHAGLADPTAFRPTLRSSSAETRVTSDPVKKSQSHSHKHKHKSSRHHHDSHDGDHRHGSSRRHAAKEAMQSAIQIQPPASFGDLLRQARGSRDTSPSHSRRQSVAPRQADGSASGKEETTPGITIPPQRPLRPADIELEAKRVEARERELRAALQSLSDQSLKISRRLDDTYYSVLEKISVLQQTIGTLHELSGLTRELHQNFEADTTELVEDVAGQVEAFDNFETQQEQVISLEERIKAGKEKADALTARLEQAKEHVDAKAKSEAEWQAKNTNCIRIFWGIVGVIAAVFFVLVLFHASRPVPDSAEQHSTRLDSASRDAVLKADIPEIAKEAIIGSPTPKRKPIVQVDNAKRIPKDDVPLRSFDEL
ncbi:hypothetical protein J3E72DRAFT_374938 [Bipolaris maydis]|nr:hypothetical protein J3E73DRAFT_369742 [Bipolaris maydis]KAJ5059575.1 hypothetical protein J3E74DRAFT_407327 [Bipolaris maydis]KAJ6197455.1 hypothetical protein J3E72DRAFT_374938 [Bipolaris maydis]KAJ6271444.1 hypothetical protein PSV08DRAFT_246940 [Bipolaris maydis]KAJ6282496.1 hypothetical protein J3E71DRAFT_240065 [Bipolaris maydis]